MKKAIILITREKYRLVKSIKGSGHKYYPASGEEKIQVKVKPATEEDLKNAFKSVGIDRDAINPLLKKTIEAELSFFSETNIAEGQNEYDGKIYNYWTYKLME